MKFLYKIIKSLFLWLAPIIIVICSVVFVSTNAQNYKQIMAKNDFYNDFSLKIKGANNQNTVNQTNLPTAIVFFSLIEKTITPTWTKNLVEKNIDLTNDWLRGQEDSWALYIPTSDLEKALNGQVDETVKKIAAENKDIPVCTIEQANNIKTNGFGDFTKQYCLPQEIKNGEISFSKFIQKNNQSDTLSVVIPESNLNQLNDRFLMQNLVEFTGQRQLFYSFLNNFRSLVVTIQNLTIPTLFGLLIFLILLILLAKMAGYTATQQLQSISFTLAISITSLVITISISFALTIIFSSGASGFFLPWLKSSGLHSVLMWKIFDILFSWVLPALYISAGFLVISFLSKTIRLLGLQSQQQKNQEILTHQNHPEISDTLDGKFKEQIQLDRPKTDENFKPVQQSKYYEEFYNPETFSAETGQDEFENFNENLNQKDTFEPEEFYGIEENNQWNNKQIRPENSQNIQNNSENNSSRIKGL